MVQTSINRTAFSELVARAQREIDEGRLPSCQLALARHGELIASETLGDATPDTLYVVFSCTKGFVSGLLWMLIGEGKLDVSRRVADYFPEFGANGKEGVTVEQVITYRSGFPRAPMGPEIWNDRAARVERMASWRLTSEPGTRYEYGPTSSHWVLAEVIDTVTGGDYRRLITDRICAPLGLSFRLGVPPEEQGDIAEIKLTGEYATADEMKAAIGVSSIDVGEVTDEALEAFNQPAFREAGVPGGGGVGTAADLAMYYQALLHNTKDLWDPEVLADATSHVRVKDPDILFGGIAANRTLGMQVAGDDGFAHLRTFGHTVSGRAFGHPGAGGQIAWADPETGLSFGFVTNGIDVHLIRQFRRGVSLASKAGNCVR
jgi:CubicO group peptidase (beta-lactamase class C family)